MSKAITALEEAISVLKDATDGHSDGVLLAQRAQAQLSEGAAARSQEAAALVHAVELGQRFLTKGDALFLRRLLTGVGDVPVPEWKDLNRRATFKMGYKARSLKILEVLTQLRETFTTSRSDAQARELEAKATSETLIADKTSQKTKAETALSDMDVEGAARGMTLEEISQEIDDLNSQVGEDEKYITRTEGVLADKKIAWEVRKELRANEIATMTEAIAILHNDDARDLFKRSFSSQSFMFLQKRQLRTSALAEVQRRDAAAELRKAARATLDARMTALAMNVMAQSNGHFTDVINAIDLMLSVLQREETKDLKNKEQCESDRALDTRSAASTSRQMDETIDAIRKLKAEIEETKADIAEKEAAIQKIQEQLKEATTNRNAEAADWKASDDDDKAAFATVESAKTVLSKFYSDNSLNFVQQPKIVAGEAPPPPPATWEEPYGGKIDGARGIISVLQLIMDDITKDIRIAKAAEDKAVAEYGTFTSDMEKQTQALSNSVTDLTGTKSDKEGSVSQKITALIGLKGNLGIVMQKIEDATPGCEFISVNYPMRVTNRQIEIDGLQKAKAILSGAEFDAGPDPNREIQPGDSLFLQRRRR
jgi:hypothetical protein